MYAPTEMRKTEEKEMFYAKLDSVLDQCPPRDTLIVLGDFNATSGTVRDGYELCVGPHGSGTRNTNSSLLLNFARSRRLRIAGSWYQRPELHRWTWYSNAGGVAKEIDHILVSTRWRILQNCRVYRSAEFFGTDHRLVVATLKLHVKSRRISRGNHTVFHLEKLKDLTCAHEYAVAVSNRFDVLGALGDPVELWDTFKRETLQAAKECIGERPRSRRGFVSTETLEKIEESRAARLAGNRDQHRALSRRTRTLLRRDKERYVRSLAEDVEGHLNANDLRPAYRALKKLRSKSPSRASAIRTADGRLVSDMVGQMARWAEYFGQLFTVDPPTEQLHTTGLQAVDADPPIDETAPSLDEVREAVAKLRGGKAAGVCNISAELLKAGGEAMIRGLHSVLTAVWQSGTIPPDWKRGLVVPIWKGKGDRQDCNNYRGTTLLSVPGKVLAHLLLTRIRSHLVKHQRPQQSGFTPGKSTTDRILALRVLVERRREFRQGMLAAYVDLKKAFDSVHLISAESLEVLVMALEALHEEAKPLGLEVSWLKTKVQVTHHVTESKRSKSMSRSVCDRLLDQPRTASFALLTDHGRRKLNGSRDKSMERLAGFFLADRTRDMSKENFLRDRSKEKMRDRDRLKERPKDKHHDREKFDGPNKLSEKGQDTRKLSKQNTYIFQKGRPSKMRDRRQEADAVNRLNKSIENLDYSRVADDISPVHETVEEDNHYTEICDHIISNKGGPESREYNKREKRKSIGDRESSSHARQLRGDDANLTFTLLKKDIGGYYVKIPGFEIPKGDCDLDPIVNTNHGKSYDSLC
ncbi:Craniofacial development protein 2 [Chionoecetes opilio]|uniref:Craniofacial development protein 2 n=1 Tax=Chionoecetes opilio TaxID=41210 RepID=A0A8J4XWD8_CHIOP|nr:Craniofacial development protein 2 [Chionoecetes opilio]